MWKKSRLLALWNARKSMTVRHVRIRALQHYQTVTSAGKNAPAAMENAQGVAGNARTETSRKCDPTRGWKPSLFIFLKLLTYYMLCGNII